MLIRLWTMMVVLLVGGLAFGISSPVPTWVNKIEPNQLKSYGADGEHLERVIRCTYDFDEHGGSSASAIDLGCDLPANAVVEKVWGVVEGTVLDDTNNQLTMALQCEDSGNLMHARKPSLHATGTVLITDVGGSATSIVRGIAAKCDVSAVFAVSEAVVGKIIFFIKYFVED